MPNSYTNPKGVTYYFHKVGHLKFFSKDEYYKGRPPDEIPKDCIIVVNKKTGLPFVKKLKEVKQNDDKGVT
ncbi:hypothetical protein DRJ17_04750 [Candidatus Woesearchaeota archaeon]|nr:MAG: hypothetical protein DRJ17_04750 [Candidatus Woesearchaeota archaeon]